MTTTVEPIDRLDANPVAKMNLVEGLVGIESAEWDALGRAAKRLGPALDPFRDALLDLMLHDRPIPLPKLALRGGLESPFVDWRDQAIAALRQDRVDETERVLAESAFRKVTEIVHLELFLSACARSIHTENEIDEPLPMAAALAFGHDRTNAA